jgi:hypothetical protein
VDPRASIRRQEARIPEVILQKALANVWVLGQTERSRLCSIRRSPHIRLARRLPSATAGSRSRAYALARAPAKAKQYLAEYERLATPSIEPYDRQELELARGWIAIAEERYDDAVQAFRAADVYRLIRFIRTTTSRQTVKASSCFGRWRKDDV